MYHNSINKSVNIYFVITGPGGFGILSFCASQCLGTEIGQILCRVSCMPFPLLTSERT
jgi:hypothetical protein